MANNTSLTSNAMPSSPQEGAAALSPRSARRSAPRDQQHPQAPVQSQTQSPNQSQSQMPGDRRSNASLPASTPAKDAAEARQVDRCACECSVQAPADVALLKQRRDSAPNVQVAACLCAAGSDSDRSYSAEPPSPRKSAKAKEETAGAQKAAPQYECTRVDPGNMRSDASLPLIVTQGWLFERQFPDKTEERCKRYWRCYTVQLDLSAAEVRSEQFLASLGDGVPLYQELWHEVLSFACEARPAVHFVVDKKVGARSNELVFRWALGHHSARKAFTLVSFESGLRASRSRLDRWEGRQATRIRHVCTTRLGLRCSTASTDARLVRAFVDILDRLDRGPICAHPDTRVSALSARVLS